MARATGVTAIGAWAKHARVEAGYSSADKAAAAAGIPPNWLRQVEAHYWTHPDPARIAQLEALYGSTAPAPEVTAAVDPTLEAYRRGYRDGWADAIAPPSRVDVAEGDAWAAEADARSRRQPPARRGGTGRS